MPIYRSFQKKMEKQVMDIESFCIQANFLTETLKEEKPTVPLKKTEFDCPDESEQYSGSGYFPYQNAVTRNQKHRRTLMALFT